jgi:hypothetical protein
MEKEPMTELSRRAFMGRAAAATAAGVAATSGIVALPGLIAAASPVAASRSTQQTALDLSPVGQDVVVHVQDASTGEVLIMVGTAETTFHDPELVSRLLKGARTAGQEA